ncbi:MAG: DNA cytosine methyltransferase [Richelia sp. RM1_1_1]|nr:DNA cytosine methyltransferase [Richelia sp. RM1_1_1]
MEAENKKIVVSLFCGVGGLDLGFEKDFEVALAIDNNPKVLAAYQKNFPNTSVLCEDIANLNPERIKELIYQKYPQWDGQVAAVIGGPPCQPFSAAGKQNPNDERNQLVIKYIDLVIGLQPETFVMENVPALEWEKYSHVTSNAWANACEHYHATKWSLVASDYGVPQKRKRIIWVGSKYGEIQPPSPSKQFSVGDAIADLENLTLDKDIDSHHLENRGNYTQYLDQVFGKSNSNIITGCAATLHNAATIDKYSNTAPGEKEPTTWSYKLKEDGFSPTLRAGSGNRTAARPIHYKHPRVITVREAARLSSFPDWFYLGDSKLHCHKAIGNSVPALMAQAIAIALCSHLDSNVIVQNRIKADIRKWANPVSSTVFELVENQIQICFLPEVRIRISFEASIRPPPFCSYP